MVHVIRRYFDTELNRTMEIGDVTMFTPERAELVKSKGYIEVFNGVR